MRTSRAVAPAVVTAAAAVFVAMIAPAQAIAANAAAVADDQAAPQNVIVVMRDQHPDLKPKVQTDQRSAAVSSDQNPVVQDLSTHGATDVKQFDTVSAVAAKVKPSEADRLRANPNVAAVVPDMTFYPQQTATDLKPSQQICPADPSKPLLEPEALDLTHTTQAQSTVTGKGVKVAFLADGIDTNNPEFIRPDGSHVFTDYQDFSGDGVHDSSGGGEAFGDASSIAAQGTRTYDLSTELPYSGLPKGCDIKIRGFAPDVSLVGIKIFGQTGTSTSSILRGIDYAVNHDKVDILSESFGGNPYPDPTTDPVTLADDAAVAAGVTVVASSGDSGISGTIGSPASSTQIIAVGATTAMRLNAQAYGYPGWTSDNITGLSSGGPTFNGKVPDLVAPGYGGMAACTVDPRWDDCTSATEAFGGTSQSAPFVAGAAALVIQAYEQAHHGTRPSPDLVKRLLTGTATDLNVPADQQGAGLLNSDAAVKAALGQGGLVPSVDQVSLSGKAGTSQHTSITLTNTSNRPQVVTDTSRTVGATTFTDARTIGITAPSSSDKLPAEGALAAAPVTFTVPPGTPLLDATMVWPGTQSSGQLSVILVDPAGKYVQQSYDYGFADNQYITVHDPVPGKWTAKIVWSNGRAHLQEPPLTPGSFRGNASIEFVGKKFASAGITGTPARVIPAGGSARFDFTVPLPATAGDVTSSVQFDSLGGSHLSVPVNARALIPAVPGQDNKFSVNVIGGVGRGFGGGQGFYLDVPGGHKSLTVDLAAPDSGTPLEFYLVSPDGQMLSGDVNATEGTWNDSSTRTANGGSSLTVDQPLAGRWQLLVILTNPVSGKEFSEQVSGKVRFDASTAKASGLPAGGSIKSGSTVTASVDVTNTGLTGQWFFLDPRLAGQAKVDLTPTDGVTSLKLPLHTSDTAPPSYLVPPHTSKLSSTVTASLPVDLDIYAIKGAPEKLALATNRPDHAVTDTASANQLATGTWGTDVQAIGPFPNGSPAGTAKISANAVTAPFDPWFSSETGDFWQHTVAGPAATPVFIPAGATRTIKITLKPTGPAGTAVRGTVYVDTFNPLIGQGSELTGIPYSYTVS
ncbi:S8 family serine peptidase [Kutzneria sp. CA-103260]|uniref:S8 family serine peptidase n=1 Tax=Kutzneria sp. CA-103260 TaxID=2802641 RepID=UPI001BA7A22D|nr:S8 family serine peptidase [Kutzneria sp. CA-103260]QUQ70363.1 Subtilase family protein [Kutzneria sp. CA-103260]